MNLKKKRYRKNKQKFSIITSKALKRYLSVIEGPNDYNYGVLKNFQIKKKIIFLLSWKAKLDEIVTGGKLS